VTWSCELSGVAERAADAAGIVTVSIGVALTLAPARTAARLGLGDQRCRARAIGLADLMLGPLLLVARPRWPWMGVRAALNLVIAREYVAGADGDRGWRRARAGAMAMTALTVLDGAAAVALRASRR
jgi:hypothetical protein